jgi:hypothetical protein
VAASLEPVVVDEVVRVRALGPASMRRRSSASSWSGTSTWKGRMLGSSVAAPGSAGREPAAVVSVIAVSSHRRRGRTDGPPIDRPTCHALAVSTRCLRPAKGGSRRRCSHRPLASPSGQSLAGWRADWPAGQRGRAVAGSRGRHPASAARSGPPGRSARRWSRRCACERSRRWPQLSPGPHGGGFQNDWPRGQPGAGVIESGGCVDRPHCRPGIAHACPTPTMLLATAWRGVSGRRSCRVPPTWRAGAWCGGLPGRLEAIPAAAGRASP